MSKCRQLPDIEATIALAKDLATWLPRGAIVLLDGPLGAGKTTLVRGLVAALGGDERLVSSPTFALMHVYDVSEGTVVHIDAYRIQPQEDLGELGLWDLADESIICIEWAQRVDQQLDPEQCWRIELAHSSGGGRQATILQPSPQESA